MTEEEKQAISRNDSTISSNYASELAMEAARRRERLRSMRDRIVAPALAAKSNSTNSSEEISELKNEDNADERPVAAYVPLFRNYTPRDEELKSLKRAKLDPADVKTPVQEQLEKSEPKNLVEDLKLDVLAPRRPDWDLKRDLERRLAKLERRTERAIAQLVVDRLQREQAERVKQLGQASES